MNSTPPIRSRAAEEGNFQIPIWGVPFIILLLYVCLFSGLGALGMVGPDEPRYAAIARAMSETHDWVTPRLWGSPWFEKPVLYYWTAGIAMRLFGVSEFAARLPSALAALLAVVAVTWTALRSYGIGAAWFTLLMLPTSVAMIAFSRAASPDMLFTGMLTATMAVAVEMLQKPRPGPAPRIAFGFFLGAAVLAKGPAAVILAGGATLLWAALSRQWLAPFRFLHPLIIAVFCATALPWYVFCAMRNPDFLRVFIWQHNFQRYLTPIFEHRQPFWFFGAVFLLEILPWLPVFISGLFEAAGNLKMESCRNSPALFITCWSLFILFFFSLSQSKLPSYILPAIPPALLLLAVSFVRQIERNAKGLRVAVACAGLVFPLIAGMVLVKRYDVFDALFRFSANSHSGFLLGFVAAFAGGVLVLGLSIYRNWVAAVNVLACTVAALLLFANFLVLPGMDEIISPRAMARGLLAEAPANQDNVAVFRVPRAYEYGLDYYFQKTLPEWAPTETGVRFIFSGKQGLKELARFLGLDYFDDASPLRYFRRAEPKGNVFIIDRNALQRPPGK